MRKFLCWLLGHRVYSKYHEEVISQYCKRCGWIGKKWKYSFANILPIEIND
jgi:hypothetical protein